MLKKRMVIFTDPFEIKNVNPMGLAGCCKKLKCDSVSFSHILADTNYRLYVQRLKKKLP